MWEAAAALWCVVQRPAREAYSRSSYSDSRSAAVHTSQQLALHHTRPLSLTPPPRPCMKARARYRSPSSYFLHDAQLTLHATHYITAPHAWGKQCLPGRCHLDDVPPPRHCRGTSVYGLTDYCLTRDNVHTPPAPPAPDVDVSA